MSDGIDFGSYEIIEPIGAGGMGKVYLAEDLRHDRRVAIKTLRAEISERLAKERFLAEIQITARLQHPHILPLFDSGQSDDLVYYVMPYVDGESLRERLERDGALPLSEALEITRQVGSALQYAHDRGVVHRDVKPENVMLQDGQAMVADFGIAIAVADADRTRFTMDHTPIGTPSYMSPEQAAGEREIDARADIYALGLLLFEMATGTRVFGGDSAAGVLAKILAGTRPHAREVLPSIPADLDAILERALAVDPDDRFASVDEMLEQLETLAGGGTPASVSKRFLWGVGLGAVLLMLTLGIAFWSWSDREGERSRIRVEAMPRIQRLIAEERMGEALAVASEAERYLPEDPQLAALVEVAGDWVDRIASVPTGAEVSIREYGSDSDWLRLGTTPVEPVRLPASYLIARFELEGYRTHEIPFTPRMKTTLAVDLVPVESAEDMVSVAGTEYMLSAEPVAVQDFRIDRLEVTNAEFQRAIETGLYEQIESWGEMLDLPSSVFDPVRGRDELVDSTGRPGPAGWRLSEHPGDRTEMPVGGVSWFEAAAYCAHRGDSLPSFYHWKVAAASYAEPWDDALVASNLAAEGPVPAGSSGAVGPNGTYDMVGNAREWVWNRSDTGRYVLGAAWDSPAYLALDYELVDPWSRDPRNGFRCVRYSQPPQPELLASIGRPTFDFRTVEPVDDATFAVYSEFFRYDPLPLNAESEVVETTDHWVRERVVIDAAYGDERFPVHVFLPRNAEPPYQAVVYFPGSDARVRESSDAFWEMHVLDFLPRSGRALLFPVLRGHFERGFEGERTPSAIRQLVIAQTQDIMRVVDLVEERPDLDGEALAYMGLSLGAELSVPVALEKRFDALVLIGAALDPAWRGVVPEEVAPWNYVSRITTPTLLVNGREDAMHPYEEGQVPFFEAIDVPDADKRFEATEGGHLPPWDVIIRNALGWLDERLGAPEMTPR